MPAATQAGKATGLCDLVHITRPVDGNHLPYLSDGFTIRINKNEWAGLFPRHHVMWVSPRFARAKEFVKAARQGPGAYADFLSEPMKQSFESHFTPLHKTVSKQELAPKGELLDSTICFLATNDCNLGCTYCFSAAEPKKFGVIPWEIAKSAIDLGARNAVLSRIRNGAGQLNVSFFGGGEPTEYWDRFAAIVEYARSSAKKSGVDVGVSTITNGQIEPEHWDWFRANIDDVTVSMDGPRDIHDAQRPTASGGSSFDKSWSFLLAMAERRMQVSGIRVTVTAKTVRRMSEIATFFWDNLPVVYPITFEPVYFSEVGRQNAEMPTAAEFVTQFRAMEEIGRVRKACGLPCGPLGTATRPLAIREGAYCDSLEGKGLYITPNGYLSLCSEISTPADPRKDDYFVGGYNSVTKRFHISETGASKIRCGPPWWCRGCFAQFSCRGGCEPRSQNSDKSVRKWWCQMVRSNVRGTWGDVRADKAYSRARIGDPQGEELIWLPIWQALQRD